MSKLIAVLVLGLALAGCANFRCAGSGDGHRDAGGCGVGTKFLR